MVFGVGVVILLQSSIPVKHNVEKQHLTPNLLPEAFLNSPQIYRSLKTFSIPTILNSIHLYPKQLSSISTLNPHPHPQPSIQHVLRQILQVSTLQTPLDDNRNFLRARFRLQ